jgi:hypothetical protein
LVQQSRGSHTKGKYATTVLAGSFINTRHGSGAESNAITTMLASKINPKIFQPIMNRAEAVAPNNQEVEYECKSHEQKRNVHWDLWFHRLFLFWLVDFDS